MTRPCDDVSILLLGAGSGARMGGQPKAFIELDGLTLLERAVRTVEMLTDDILIGLPANDIARGADIVDVRAQVMEGGDTRQATVSRLLQKAKGQIVVVHDVARPYVTAKHFEAVIEGARQHRACVLAEETKVRDSLCRDCNGFAGDMVDRQGLMKIQTPQAFNASLLRLLLSQAERDGQDETSLVSLFRHAGYPVKLSAGDSGNVKITYPEDLIRR